MDFTRDGLGKSMGSSRETHGKDMRNTWAGDKCVPHPEGLAHVK